MGGNYIVSLAKFNSQSAVILSVELLQPAREQ